MARAAPVVAAAPMEANTSALSSSLFFHGDVSHTSDEGPSRLHQLTASFALDEAEVAFFDAVMAALPAASTSFSELKHAYSECKHDISLMRPIERTHALRASQGDPVPSTEARLWNTLLSLVQVRGHTWAERWDAIRVSLGLEPLDEALWGPAPGSPPAAEMAPDALHTGARPTWSPLQLVHQRVPPRALDAVRWPRIPHETLLERRAADLERRHMRRFLVRWNDALFFCVSRQERAAHAHASLLALRTWAQWRARYAARQYAADAAVALAREAVMRHAFHAWRIATSERLQARHKAHARTLRAAFLTLAARRDARVGRIAMTLWMQAWHGRQARQYRRGKLLPRAWDAWRTRFTGLATLESKRTLFAAYAHRRLLGAAIDAWRQRLGEQRRAAYQAESAMAWNEQRLIRTAWRRWAAARQHCTVRMGHTHADFAKARGAPGPCTCSYRAAYLSASLVVGYSLGADRCTGRGAAPARRMAPMVGGLHRCNARATRYVFVLTQPLCGTHRTRARRGVSYARGCTGAKGPSSCKGKRIPPHAPRRIVRGMRHGMRGDRPWLGVSRTRMWRPSVRAHTVLGRRLRGGAPLRALAKRTHGWHTGSTTHWCMHGNVRAPANRRMALSHGAEASCTHVRGASCGAARCTCDTHALAPVACAVDRPPGARACRRADA